MSNRTFSVATALSALLIAIVWVLLVAVLRVLKPSPVHVP